MNLIQNILSQINDFIDNDKLNYFIMEPKGYPSFLQFAKVGDNFILDIPATNFFDISMQKKTLELLMTKFKKEIKPVNDKKSARLATYQVRFSANEINKMCYVAKEVFEECLGVKETAELSISTR